MNSKFLYLLGNHIPDHYRIYRIPKKNGNFRTIEAPAPILKLIQRYILVRVLPVRLPWGESRLRETEARLRENGIRFRPGEIPRMLSAARAFERGCSIGRNAAAHCGKPIVVSLDVKNFFPSLKYGPVRAIFQELAEDDASAVMLAKFCTLNGHLPQGAVTSPHLSNLLMRDFDAALAEYSLLHGLAYTRYADDLTFSGDPSNEEITELIRRCRSELATLGLRLNRDKIRIQRKGMRQEVTGVVVNAKVSAPRKIRRELRQRMYYLNKHWETEWRKLDEHSLNVLLGKANFIWDLNRNDPEVAEYRRQLLEIRRFFHN
ncbi:MAG: RNA-directed DNA polymerase [Lentisphaeria bacterium]|nr:RNA-directed DNA polymerase [Lentisphaeria bacterium]